MKKRKNPVLVISVIIILSLFIILPPTLRSFYPKPIDQPTDPKKKKIVEILTCQKTSTQEQYKVNSKIKYVNQIAEENVITYTKIAADTEQQKVEEQADLAISPKTIAEELALFQTIATLTVVNNDPETIVTITADDIAENDANSDFMNYLLPIEDQKVFYISQGYTCKSTKS